MEDEILIKFIFFKLSAESLEFAKLLETNGNAFADGERAIGQESIATLYQIKQVVRFIKFYSASRLNVQSNVKNSTIAEPIDGTSSRSLFEILLSIYQNLHVGRVQVVIRIDEDRRYFQSLFSNIKSLSFEEASPVKRSAYCVQIIFDSSDVASAFAELANAGVDRTAPWRIRQCWVQESLRAKFEAEFPSDGVVDATVLDLAQPFGAIVLASRRVALPLIVGVTEAHVDSDGVILVNFFRTPKDCVDLLAKKRQTVGAGVAADEMSVSVWTENISLAVEMASILPALNVWINSVGLLDPNVPFTFGGNYTVYGSDLALIQAAAATGLAEVDDPNTNLAKYLDE